MGMNIYVFEYECMIDYESEGMYALQLYVCINVFKSMSMFACMYVRLHLCKYQCMLLYK